MAPKKKQAVQSVIWAHVPNVIFCKWVFHPLQFYFSFQPSEKAKLIEDGKVKKAPKPRRMSDVAKLDVSQKRISSLNVKIKYLFSLCHSWNLMSKRKMKCQNPKTSTHICRLRCVNRALRTNDGLPRDSPKSPNCCQKRISSYWSTSTDHHGVAHSRFLCCRKRTTHPMRRSSGPAWRKVHHDASSFPKRRISSSSSRKPFEIIHLHSQCVIQWDYIVNNLSICSYIFSPFSLLHFVHKFIVTYCYIWYRLPLKKSNEIFAFYWDTRLFFVRF